MSDFLKNAQANLSRINSINYAAPDKRTRAERQEDLVKRLAAIDASAITELRKSLPDNILIEDGEIRSWNQREDVDDALYKFQQYIKEFDDLNSEESRKVRLKEEELKVIAKYDWREKFRLFFFRILASSLFVGTIFTIGYLEHNYEWAKLPLTKYIKPVPKLP